MRARQGIAGVSHGSRWDEAGEEPGGVGSPRGNERSRARGVFAVKVEPRRGLQSPSRNVSSRHSC